MANLRYTPLQALTTNDIARESTDDTTSLPSLRRRQALERMKLRETEKQHQKDLDLNASLRSSQRRRAAVEIARAKRARITAKKRQQEERKQKTHEAQEPDGQHEEAHEQEILACTAPCFVTNLAEQYFFSTYIPLCHVPGYI